MMNRSGQQTKYVAYFFCVNTARTNGPLHQLSVMLWVMADGHSLEDSVNLLIFSTSEHEYLFQPFALFGAGFMLDSTFRFPQSNDVSKWHQYTFTYYQDPESLVGRMSVFLDGMLLANATEVPFRNASLTNQSIHAGCDVRLLRASR